MSSADRPIRESSADSATNPPARSRTTSMAAVAERVSSWTSRLIVSALILVAGLGFGRQVLRWWADDAPAASTFESESVSPGGLGDLGVLHGLEFGSSDWTMSRQTVSGDRQTIARRLEELCRAVGPASRLPKAPAGAEEKRYVAALAAQKPAAEKPGQWRLYVTGDLPPVAVVTRPQADAREEVASSPVAASADRVVTWAIAVPERTDVWTLYAFAAGGTTAITATTPGLPMPEDARRTLAIHTAEGGAVVAFRGSSSLGSWRSFFEERLAAAGWTLAGEWNADAAHASARYVGPASGRAFMADLHIHRDGGEEIRGLVVVGPRDDKPTETAP